MAKTFVQDMQEEIDELRSKDESNTKIIEFLNSELKSSEQEAQYLAVELRQANDILAQYNV